MGQVAEQQSRCVDPGKDGAYMAVAAQHPGTNPNVLTGPDIDPLTGNAILNGVPVSVRPAPTP